MDVRPQLSSEEEPGVIELDQLLKRMMKGVNGQVFRTLGDTVLAGPFQGMIIPLKTPFWDDGNFSTKLVGQYEHEIQNAIEFAIHRNPEVIINIGCSEGYYAIGMARRCPQATVYAFDINAEARLTCLDYCLQNNVVVNFVEGARSAQELSLKGEKLKGKRLYIVDVEGDEDKLIDLENCSELKNSDLIIECHDFLKSNITETIRERLLKTHTVAVISPRMPDFEKVPFLGNSPTVMSVMMVVEKRPMPSYWLVAWANNRGD